MDPAPCQRCGHIRRPRARYCATCGCPFLPDEPTAPGPQPTPKGMIVPWIVLATLCLAMLCPPVDQRPRGLVYSPRCQRATGLVMDFPAEYPPGYFNEPQR